MSGAHSEKRDAIGQVDFRLPTRSRCRPVVMTRTGFVCWTMPWQRAGRDVLTVVCKATCDLVPDAPATIRAAGDPPTGDLHWGDDPAASLRYPSDFAPHKAQADVVLLGTAFPPRSGAIAGLVRFRFGPPGSGFERRVAVVGPRRWRQTAGGRVADEPAPFSTVPLRCELAYGGPAFAANPVGRGFQAARGPDGQPWLPQLENPDRLIQSPRDVVEPVLLGPIAPGWPERWRGLGSYDARWLAERWPHLPDDFDFQHYQAAPAPQRVAYLRGDEPLEIEGVRPDGAALRATLPALRPRCVRCELEQGALALHPVTLELDTVVIDTDAMTLHLLWRGLLGVSAAYAPEVAALYVVSEPVGSPLSLEQLRSSLAAERALREAPEAGARVRLASANDVRIEAGRDGGDSVDAADAQAICREQLARAGIPAAWFDGALRPSPAKPAREAIARALVSDGAQQDEVQRLLRQLELERDRADTLRAEATRRLANHETLAGCDFTGADLSELDLRGQSLVKTTLLRANLRGARLAGADLSDAQLGGADLSDAVLAGAMLAGADFAGAKLDHAAFDEARLDRTSFVRSSARAARFCSVQGGGARFSEADLSGAQFADATLPGADFSGATLDEADFHRARLPKLRLYDVVGGQVRFADADLSDARADAARLEGSSFRQASAAGSIWDDAVLDGCDFFSADLHGASFCAASCSGALFSQADLRQAVLREARLADASMLRADMAGCSLESALLTGADLRGANLHGAELWKAELSDAKLELALVTGTKLARGER